MNSWVRLWHDMPTDPKWRGIARRSGQSISEVMAVFVFAMVNASANADERGRTHNLFADDIADALNIEVDAVEAILEAFRGKVLDDGGFLTGWEKRQPKREDGSAERAKAWRDERKRTQANASERPDKDADTDAETLTNVSVVVAPKRSRPLKFVPDGWEPNEAHFAKASDLGVDLATEVGKFRNHEYAKPKTDFDRAFHTWLTNAAKFNPKAKADERFDARHENYRASWAGSEQAAGVLAARRNL